MSVFTEYVLSLDSRRGPPAAEELDRLWSELRAALAREIRRRHLWSQPPSHLGIYGSRSWTEPDTPHGDALDELAAECYAFVFLDCLRSLQAHARTKPNVDGLVVLHVRNFLHGVQKKNDPLGFKVFDALRAALRHLLEQGSLHVLKGSQKVRNDTVFGFAADEDPEEAEDPLSGSDVGSWGDEIVPALISTRGETSAEAVSRLAARISQLPEHNVRAFRFRELVDPLKDDVRARWGKILEELQGERVPGVEGEDEAGKKIVRLIAVTQPETDFEKREWFDRIADCVDRGLRQLTLRAKAREYLERLWSFLHGYALDVASEKLPSYRKLSELLDIPRERFPGLYEILGGLLEQCRGSESAKLQGATVKVALQSGPSRGARSMDANTRREELRLRTGEALARLAEAEPESSAGGAAEVGGLYVLAQAGETPLEWAVLYRAAGRCLVVPVDTFPLAGSADVTVGREAASGPLRLRCAFAVWIDAKLLSPRERSGSIDTKALGEARAKLAETEEGAVSSPLDPPRGTVSALPSQLEADRDGDYEDWIEDVLAPARDALVEARPRRRTSGRRPAVVPLALAAALLVAVVGLALYGAALRSQIDVLSQPSVAVARQEIVFKEVPRDGEELVVRGDASHVLFPLLLHRVTPHDGYVLEIVDGGRETVWRSDVLEPKLQYRLLVPRSRLPAGVYFFRLLAVTEGGEALLDEQERRVEYREP